MTLAAGAKLGPYQIQSMLGAGGMGEVYRAHDARLNRTVAIKVLPASFSADRDRLPVLTCRDAHQERGCERLGLALDVSSDQDDGADLRQTRPNRRDRCGVDAASSLAEREDRELTPTSSERFGLPQEVRIEALDRCDRDRDDQREREHHLRDDHVFTRTEHYCTRCTCRYFAFLKPKLAANRFVGRLRR